jgi:hypothetical protein
MEQELLFSAKVIAIVGFCQALLYGLSKALELVMNKTETDVDNKAYRVCQYILTFFDIITGNREHKEHVNGRPGK